MSVDSSRLIKPVQGFTIVQNSLINNPFLSFKAKGIYAYLMSKPDGWNFSSDRIASDSVDGIKSVLSGLKELENNGYLLRVAVRSKGIFYGYDYHILQPMNKGLAFVPSSPNGVTVVPSSPKRRTVKRRADNGQPYKERDSKKDIVIERENNLDNFPFIDDFLIFLIGKGNVKNSVAYSARIKGVLLNPKSSKYNQTVLAYEDFINGVNRSSNSLPDGVNIFDLIGRKDEK